MSTLREQIIRTAASLPKGSAERRALLKVVAQTEIKDQAAIREALDSYVDLWTSVNDECFLGSPRLKSHTLTVKKMVVSPDKKSRGMLRVGIWVKGTITLVNGRINGRMGCQWPFDILTIRIDKWDYTSTNPDYYKALGAAAKAAGVLWDS